MSLVGIILAGALLRFWVLGQIPAGLYQDEAFNGLDALDVLAGSHSLYFPANNGREPFFIYMVAGSVGLLGRTPLTVRLPAAILGLLTIPAVYALGRVAFNRRIAVLAAFVMATTFWPVALSRIGFRAVALPCLIALSLAAVWTGYASSFDFPFTTFRALAQGERVKRRVSRARCHVTRWSQMRPYTLLALGGAFYGLSFYTYLAARFTPLALLLFAGYWVVRRRRPQESAATDITSEARHVSRFLPAICFFVPAILVALPLGLYALAHPEVIFGRAGQVSIFSPAINGGDPWRALGRHTLDSLGMFVWRGDSIARHNLAGRPVFDPIMGLAFLGGLSLCLRSFRRSPAAAFCLIWVAVMLLPTLLAEDTPHFLRGVGVWPMLAFLPAVGLEAGYSWLARRALPLARLALGLVLGLSLGLTLRDYFGRYARDPVTAYYFQSALADLAGEARTARQEGAAIYLDRRFWDQFASLRFLLQDGPDLRRFDEGEPLRPDPAPLVSLFIWPYEAVAPSLGALPEGALIEASPGPLYRGDLEPSAYVLYYRYLASKQEDTECLRDTLCPDEPLGCFQEGICLQAAKIGGNPRTGESLIELTWFASGAPHQDYYVFLHARAGDDLLAGEDGPPASGLYPTSWWRPGDRVRETRIVALPVPAEPANFRWRIGVYDPATGLRLTRIENGLEWIELRP